MTCGGGRLVSVPATAFLDHHQGHYHTRKSHLGAVTGLACHYRQSPDSLDARQVQDYLIHLHEKRGLTWTSCNAARHAIRFLYRITLGRLPDPHLYVPGGSMWEIPH